jgi:hypothetical protein
MPKKVSGREGVGVGKNREGSNGMLMMKCVRAGEVVIAPLPVAVVADPSKLELDVKVNVASWKLAFPARWRIVAASGVGVGAAPKRKAPQPLSALASSNRNAHSTKGAARCARKCTPDVVGMAGSTSHLMARFH